MNREDARKYFEQCNLTYKDIDIAAIYKLIKVLNKKIAEADNFMIMINTPRLNGKNKNIIIKDKTITFAALTVKGDYFDDREAITFNKNCFIGFCGWASDDNAQIFIDSFKEWCDYMKKVSD